MVLASISTLARHEEHYAELMYSHQLRLQRRRSEDQGRDLRLAEPVVLKCVELGVRPSLRRATEITGFNWLHSQQRSVLLIELRRALGEPRLRSPFKALYLGVALKSKVA